MAAWFKKQAPGVEEAPGAGPEGDPGEGGGARPGLLARLRDRLGKTQTALTDRLRSAIGLKQKVDETLLEELEEILIQGDVGAAGSDRIISRLREEGRRREVYEPGELTELIKETVCEILTPGQRSINLAGQAPRIILIVGVNGTGKTTTIGKLSLDFARQGKRVLLVAADTFRAAAVEQLKIWAERSGAEIVASGEGADPAAVCFDGLDRAKSESPDIVLIDTAGRLHTKSHLMDELSKIIRVIQKVYPDAPHETVLTLDATTGQNALSQVATFKEVSGLTGLIMTKLDGTAKGGILVAIKQAHPELPVFKIGIGEGAEDLRDFDAGEFADALFSKAGE